MSSYPSASPPHQEINIRKNPKTNTSVVAAHERLERELKKLGVEIKSSYNIEPAFGRRPTRHRKQTHIKNYNRPIKRQFLQPR